MASPGNLICMRQLMNRFCRTNIYTCRFLSTNFKGTGSCLHVFRRTNRKLVSLLQPNRNLSPSNSTAIGRQGLLIPSSDGHRVTTPSGDYVTDSFSRIPGGNCKFMSSSSSSSSSSRSNRQASSRRYRLSDVVDTPYGVPATMKEVNLTEQIIASVCYEDENLIAINKPLGTHVFGQTIPGQEDELGYGVPINPDIPPQPYACIADIMPILRKHFQCHYLQIVHSIKMYYTGVLIMAKSKQVKDAVIQAIDRSKSPGLTYQTYLAVTSGIPQIEGIKESTFFLTQKKHQGELLSFPCLTASKNQRKQSQVQKFSIRSQVLKRNHTLNCALVRFDTSKDKWHSTEVYATQELCSILGDYLYSSRVSKISNIPVKVEPHGAEVGKQKLSPALKKILRSNSREQMPLHLHRAKVDLVNFQKKHSTVSILAPYPNYFVTTLKKLDLHLPFLDIFKDDSQNG